MTTGPGTVLRVVVVANDVDVVTVVDDVDVVPGARAKPLGPPVLQPARARSPRAVTIGRTHLVSPDGPARDARAPARRDLRPAAGDRPGRRGRGVRRILPLRPPDALRPGRSRSRAHGVVGHARRNRAGDE